ncbi:MAG: ComF family protein [Deltaproteobacteria bacterium]|nr:ComF family protein [Deltaproteobacteria bacterium]
MKFSLLGRRILHFIFPPRCPLCDAFVDIHDQPCSPCERSLQRLEGDFTPMRLDRVWFRQARSCLAYEGKVVDAIHAFKYGRRLDLISFFAHLMQAEVNGCDVIIPVPLHTRKLFSRGYNQAALLATRVGKAACIPVVFFALKRTGDGEPQVGKEGEARIDNVKGLFAVHDRRRTRLEGKSILLIDDVLTTGATVNECAKILIKAGAAAVDVLTIARPL